MLKKYQEVKWTTKAKNSFENIKMALTEAPVLVSSDFTKEFLTFSFASRYIGCYFITEESGWF